MKEESIKKDGGVEGNVKDSRGSGRRVRKSKLGRKTALRNEGRAEGCMKTSKGTEEEIERVIHMKFEEERTRREEEKRRK